MVEKNEEVSEITQFLEDGYGTENIKSLLTSGTLRIGTQKTLEEQNF
jgi:hypothetical protein